MGVREAKTIDDRFVEKAAPLPVDEPPGAVPVAEADGPRVRAADTSHLALTAYDTDRPVPPPGARQTGDPLLGTRIDHFEIRALLGEGGMGTVYLAHDLSLERPVALKVMRRDLAMNPELSERLISEARAQARLQHANVVTIYYIGFFEGVPYFAMEYIPGRNLQEHIAGAGPLRWHDALEYIIQTTRALMEAHRRRLVHRDIKPSNLILAKSAGIAAQVKVADFGLAAPAGYREERFVGSPYYASPEQMQGRPPDFRSDIYSLGVTFHELLTGSPPFQSDSLPELLAKHMNAPRPSIDSRTAPWRLRQLIAEMMAPEPTDRPFTYEELLKRLIALRPRPTIAGGVAARGIALAVDLSLVLLVVQILVGALGMRQPIGNEIALSAFGLYYIVGHRYWGQTLGKRLFGLRLQGTTRAISIPGLALRFLVEFWGPIIAVLMVHLHLGSTTSLDNFKDDITRLVGVPSLPVVDALTAGLFRAIVVPNLALLAIPWIGGFFFALFDEEKQALHDRAARTKVVYAIRDA